MTRQQVLSMIKNSKNVAGDNYVLVDLRRADHEVASTFFMCGKNNYSSLN